VFLTFLTARSQNPRENTMVLKGFFSLNFELST